MAANKDKIIIYNKPLLKKDIDRFWSRVDIRTKNECWEWQAGLNSNKPGFEYGAIWVNGKGYLAHRLAIIIHLGRNIKKNHEVMHTCDNPKCCNPYHLLEGTHTDNMRDMYNKNRRTAQKGVERYNAKLNDSDVRTIRKLFAYHQKYKKYTRSYLAKKYKVDYSLIKRVCEYKAWKHIKD